MQIFVEFIFFSFVKYNHKKNKRMDNGMCGNRCNKLNLSNKQKSLADTNIIRMASIASANDRPNDIHVCSKVVFIFLLISFFIHLTLKFIRLN